MPVFRNSRYLTSGVRVNEEGKKEFKIRERLTFNEEKADIHQVKPGERLDLIADEYYGDPQLWWVIMDANSEYDFPFDIENGDEIIIPDEREVRRKLP